MQPSQIITYMAKGNQCRPSVCISTVDQSINYKNQPMIPSKRYETLVYYTDIDEPLPLFEDFPAHIQEFGPVHCPSHLLGKNKNSQHRYAVDQLKKQGYVVATHVDNDEIWNKMLEGIPSLDLLGITQREWNNLKILKYLREQGKI